MCHLRYQHRPFLLTLQYFQPLQALRQSLPRSLLDDGINSVVDGNWSIKNLTITFTEAELTGIIEDCFIHIFENISEIISHENVDCVLLTGRPSQNDLIIDLFKKCCPVNPDRIYSMSKYNTGPWYTFRSPKNTVGDPKSSVAVGAMLIALAGSRR